MSDVESRFNIDGPHTPDLAAQAAADIAHLVRYLNHATLWWNAEQSLPHPRDAARILGDLDVAIGRLPQLFGHISAVLVGFDGPHLRADDGDGAVMVEVAIGALTNAQQQAGDLATIVGRARSAADRLYISEGER